MASRARPVPLQRSDVLDLLGHALVLGLALAIPASSGASADPAPAPPSGETARALSRPGNPEAGAVAYASCAACHGAQGLGRSDGTFPRIAGQYASVVVKQIEDMRQGRRGNPIMTSHLETMTDPAEIADVAAYVAGLSPTRTASAPSADSGDDRGDGGHGGKAEEGERLRARGAALYRRDCAGCHGPEGKGDAKTFVPVVAGQHYAYLLRQLRAIAGSLRRNAHEGMVDAVYDYRDDELRAVAAYLAALPWPRPGTER